MVKPDKSRYVWLYLPSKADKERWQALADKVSTPLSTWAIEIIESTLAENEGLRPRRELMKEMEGSKKENKGLRDDLTQKNIVLERYESELKRFRSHTFVEGSYEGVRRYSKELVEVLKRRGQVDSYRLLEELDIDPRESEQVKALSRQLEELEGYGMIKAEAKGWRWIG